MTKTKKKRNSRKRKKQNDNPQKNLQSRLLHLLNQNPGKRYSYRQIQKRLKISSPKRKSELEHILLKLLKAGQIQMPNDYSFQAVVKPDYVTGRIDYVSRDFGFLVSEELDEDLKISNKRMKQALHGDTVRVQIHKRNSGKLEGEVAEVLERGQTEFVGRIEVSSRFAFVIADNRKMHYDIFVRLKDLNQAEHGEKVIVELLGWDESGRSPMGRVKERLGQAGEHQTEMHAIMAEYGLPVHFPKEVEAEAEQIPTEILESEIQMRRDFRDVPTFTIDPADAKDFDDALSFSKLENGHYEIGVHIADVTHYVKPNTKLEKEAYKRATSVYLVDRVVPMLPEKLSNQVCSLRPKEDKLTFSAVFEITPRGRVASEWFGRTIINSDQRFSYEEAQEVIESNKGDFAEELQILNRLAKNFMKKRFRKGAISFETVEVKFRLAEDGTPLELVPKHRKDAHKLIEEFMLLANKKVAEYVYKLKKRPPKNTMVYRIHDAPDPEKVQDFSVIARKFGYEFDLDPERLADNINALTDRVQGRPEQNVLESMAIRTMAKALYTTQADEHFGLAFKHYTHFTSPIRRYPDVMVHRLLQHYLDGKQSPDSNEWEKRCQHSTDMEKRAADAERASIKYKQVEFMQAWEQENLAGIITGLTEWGMYVEISETKCEGMIRLADLQGDYYELDSKNFQIVGRDFKRKFSLGDAVKVNIKGTDLEKRQIDLVLCD